MVWVAVGAVVAVAFVVAVGGVVVVAVAFGVVVGVGVVVVVVVGACEPTMTEAVARSGEWVPVCANCSFEKVAC